jgi:hypothetical protein
MSRLRALLAANLIALAAGAGGTMGAEPKADVANDSPMFLDVVEAKPISDGRLRIEVAVLNNGETTIVFYRDLDYSLCCYFGSASSLLGPVRSPHVDRRSLVSLEPGRSVRLSKEVSLYYKGHALDHASMKLEYGGAVEDFDLENRAKLRKSPVLDLWKRQP